MTVDKGILHPLHVLIHPVMIEDTTVIQGLLIDYKGLGIVGVRKQFLTFSKSSFRRDGQLAVKSTSKKEARSWNSLDNDQN
jgi:hypothetical protein